MTWLGRTIIVEYEDGKIVSIKSKLLDHCGLGLILVLMGEISAALGRVRMITLREG